MSFLIDFGSSQLLPSRPVLIQNRWHRLCLAETLQQAELRKKKKKKVEVCIHYDALLRLVLSSQGLIDYMSTGSQGVQ